MQIYETAIKLSMVETGVLAGISAIVAQLAKGTGEVKKFETALGSLKTAAWGAAGMFAGWGAIKGIKHLADDAKELSHQLANIQKLGLTPAQVAAARSAAFALSGQVPGTVSAGGAEILSNINSIVDAEGARKMLEPLAKFGQAMGAQSGDYDKANENILKLVRSGDLLGKFVDSATRQVDLNKLQSFLDLVAKVSAATHGMVGPATWLAMAQQGGPALSSMTDEGLMSMAMAAQAMGGFRSGTAMTSLYQQMIGGKMTQYAAQELQNMGLVGSYSVGKGGHLLWDKGALDSEFTRALQKDPLAATEILRKAMESHGFTSIETQIPELFKILGRQTTQRLVHDFLRNEPQMFGERGRMMKGEGVAGQLSIANATDYERNVHNVTAAWSDMMAKIGLPITQAAIPVMQKITEVFLKIGTLTTVHPEAIANIATGITVLGAALMGGGGIAMLSALGPAGWLAAGIIGAGAAMALWKNPILTWLESVRTTNWNEEITKALEPAIVAIKAWFLNLGTAIMNALKGMWENMKGAIGDMIKGWSPISGSMSDWGGVGGGSSAGALSAGERGQYAGIIKKVAAQEGVDSNALLKIYGTEGASAWYGDGGKSFGPFQLYTGGGLGNIYHGSRERSAQGVEEQTRFVARYGKSHGGWSSNIWHGLRGHGGSIPSGRQQETHLHNTIYLDGKMIAKSTSKHLVRAAQYPTSVGRQDGRGTFMGPGAEVFA